MNLSKRVTTIFVGLAAFAAPAFAQLEGPTVGALEGEMGSVIVMRGAETFSLQTGDSLVEGDIVMTRSNGSVTIVNGTVCSRELGGLQSLTITADMCVQEIAAVDQSGLVAGDEAVEGGVGAALPIIGGLAALGGAAAAAGGGGDDDTPTSP